MILQKLHRKTIMWSLQNYILYIDTTQLLSIENGF
jgi:hypothetical protein